MRRRNQPPGNDYDRDMQSPQQPPGEAQPLEVSHALMNDARGKDESVPFAESIPWLARYGGSWWVEYERGWLRITDEQTVADLDQRAALMAGTHVDRADTAASP